MKIALIGATGLVGNVMMNVLAERDLFSDAELILAASAKSAGKIINYRQKSLKVITVEKAIESRPDFAIFSAGSQVSLQYAPLFAAEGVFVVDNSSAWRDSKPLIVPEINADILCAEDKIIANPNCSTIQMVMALAPLHKSFSIKRIVVSTYQSITGTGVKAVNQLMGEREGKNVEMVYPYQIDMNLFPHAGSFLDNGYTSEEMKLVHETRKILGDDTIKITSTVVRVPVTGGHSEAVNIEFVHDFTIDQVYELLGSMPGIKVLDDIQNNVYPTPKLAEGKDEVFVGRIRKDESNDKSLNLWITADNLRKGAATNAVQIVEYLTQKFF